MTGAGTLGTLRFAAGQATLGTLELGGTVATLASDLAVTGAADSYNFV